MCQHQYDITYNDLNPTIFFASKQKMLTESAYHDHDFTEFTFILSGKGKYLFMRLRQEMLLYVILV